MSLFFRNNTQMPRVQSFSANFTTAVFTFMPALQQFKVAIRIVIDNQDPSNALTFQKNGVGGQTFILPPNSVAIIENEVLDGVIITPNATTGVGNVTADLADRRQLEKGGFLSE